MKPDKSAVLFSVSILGLGFLPVSLGVWLVATDYLKEVTSGARQADGKQMVEAARLISAFGAILQLLGLALFITGVLLFGWASGLTQSALGVVALMALFLTLGLLGSALAVSLTADGELFRPILFLVGWPFWIALVLLGVPWVALVMFVSQFMFLVATGKPSQEVYSA